MSSPNLWKSKILKTSKFLLVFIIVFSWFFSGWPRVWQNPPIPPEIQEAQAAQFGRPSSDVTVGAWTSTPLYASIDETPYSDTDLVTSAKNAAGDTFEVGLSSITDPATSSGHIMRYRAKNEAAGHTVAIYLMQGATQIATYNPTLTLSFVTYNYTLTAAEADSITNYADLRLKFVGNASAAKYVHVSWAEFEVPDANAIPSVSAVNLTPSPIVLTENTTTSVTCTATITDTDGGTTISSATATIYRSGVTNGSACTASNDDCYQIASGDCALSAAAGNIKYATCTADIWFHADPTDAGTYVSETWQCEVTGTDSSSAIGSATDASPPELDTLNALIVTGSIDYGTLGQGATSSSSKLTVATTTGNAAIDVNISGTDMDDNNSHSFSTSYQEYSLTEVDYGSGTDASSTAAALVLESGKPTTNPSDAADNIYWRIGIPVGQDLGTYYSTTTIAAKAK